MKQMRFPVLLRSANLVVSQNGQAHGFYHIPQLNYEFLSDGERF
ncbi:MAG: hypothetical protein M0Z65_10890 [Firmicutes bacterium]|nr:hypothetical protein [Bacillota bacterium]